MHALSQQQFIYKQARSSAQQCVVCSGGEGTGGRRLKDRGSGGVSSFMPSCMSRHNIKTVYFRSLGWGA